MDPFLNDLLEKTNNEFQTSTKTEEEIKRLTLEENMTEVKRTVHILNRGQQIQKFSIYLNLHRIMLEPDAFNSILPLVAGEILNQSEEIQIQAAKSLIKLIQNKVHIPSNKPNEVKTVAQSNIIQIFQITCSILKIWNQVVLDEWVHVFNEILKRVPYEAISRECESTILSLSEASQHSLSKYVAVRLIGFVAGNGIKNTSQLFDRARILCQDPDFEIRKALAEEVMLKICLNVGTELTESKYLEKIMELHYDSNMSIKLAAISSLVKALEILSYDFRKNRMVYVFLELMNSVNEEVMKKISFYIGEIIYKLEDVIPKNSNQMNQIQNIYRDWSMNRNPEIKRNVIYNLPYMLTLYDNKDHFLSLYLKVLKDTSTTHAQTKMIGVSCFHEICKVFKSEDFPQSLRDMFETLMKEDNSEISEKLVLHLDELIPIFQNEKEEVKSGSLTEREEEKDRKDTTRDKIKEKYVKDLQKEDQNTSCLDQLLKLAEQLKTSCLWRHEIIFMNHINKCENYFELRELAYKYVNYLVERIVGGVKEVQTTAIDSLICILKKNYIPKRTAEIMYQVVQSLTNASNHQKRITFLEFYDKFAENFSKRFFKTHNLTDPVMKMGEDKVPEVRKKFLEKCITIRRMLNQNEALLIVRLEDHAAKNRMDKNPRIANLAKETLKELKSLTQYYFSECDEEDRRKMAEEDRLLEKEQRELEETKRRHSEDIRRDKGDYLLPFSSLMNSAASKKGGKNTINFKPGPKPSSFNPSSNTVSMTPKTKILGAQLYSSGLSMAKTSSHPGTSTHVDEHESKGKDTLPKIVKPGVKLNGSAQAGVKKIDSPSTLSSGAKLSPIITGMESLSKSAVMMSNGPSASIFKNEPKIPSIKSGPAQESLKHPTKDLVKVPKIIKKKI